MTFAGVASAQPSGPEAAGKGAATGVPQTFKVGVDAKADGFNASFLHYFPDQLTARPGDTIEFVGHFTGEPHTVITGSAISDLFAAYDKHKDDKEETPHGRRRAARQLMVRPPHRRGGDRVVGHGQ